MNLSAPPQFKADDYPDLSPDFLDVLNRSFRDLFDVLQALPASASAVDKFVTSDSSGKATLELQNTLPSSPTDVGVSVRNDAAPDAAVAWGFTWRVLATGAIRVSFAGLTASTKYRINVRYS